MIQRTCLFANAKSLTHRSISTSLPSAVGRIASIASHSKSPSQYSYSTQRRVTLRLRPTARYYSSEATINSGESQVAEKDASKSGDGEKARTNADVAEDQSAGKPPSDVELKEKEIIDLKDKYLRSVADYRNLQDRTKREVQAARDYAIQRFATDLLESLDNFDRALGQVSPEKLQQPYSTAPKMTPGPSSSAPSQSSSPLTSSETSEESHKDLLNLHSGLQMTQRVLMQTLRRHGLVSYDPTTEGASFDPNKHEAMFQAPQNDKVDGSVFHTQQKGYMLNGRVLRAAKVGVVKNG